MLRGRAPRLLAAVVLVALGLVVLRVALWRPFEVEGEAPRDGYTRVSGVVHVHTTLSDGGGTPEEVIAEARAAGLAFVAITDHNNLDAKPFAGLREGMLVLVGVEISTTAGHVLGLGLRPPGFRFDGEAGNALDDVHHLGGFSFAAHPLTPRDDLRWTGWDLPGPWGVELINGDSEWRKAGGRNLATAGLYAFNREYALLLGLGAPDELLGRWDAMLARRDVAGIAGADAHSRLPITKRWSLRLPSYRSIFSLVRNHVLLDRPLQGNFDEDARAVLDAVRRGRLYVGVDALAPADAFSFTVEGPGGRWTMGDSVPAGPGLVARAGGRMPRGARILLHRDGRVVREAAGTLAEPLPGPGVYRVTVQVPGWRVPWIITNGISVFDEVTLRQRARQAELPAPLSPPSASVVIDDFDGPTPFQAGSDRLSRVHPPIQSPGAGVDGGPAARLEFELGVPTPEHPHVFCALVDWTHRDLRSRSGLVFWIRGDGEHRIWVQVRDENPASADEGTEWWFDSVRTSLTWTQVVVPFARLRSINPKSDGRLDLDKVRAIVFVLDRGAMPPGTRGTIWLDRLAVY